MLNNLFLSKTLLDASTPWQIGLQEPATPIMEGIINFHHDLMFYLIIIITFILWMLIRCIFLFNERK